MFSFCYFSSIWFIGSIRLLPRWNIGTRTRTQKMKPYSTLVRKHILRFERTEKLTENCSQMRVSFRMRTINIINGVKFILIKSFSMWIASAPVYVLIEAIVEDIFGVDLWLLVLLAHLLVHNWTCLWCILNILWAEFHSQRLGRANDKQPSLKFVGVMSSLAKFNPALFWRMSTKSGAAEEFCNYICLLPYCRMIDVRLLIAAGHNFRL